MIISAALWYFAVGVIIVVFMDISERHYDEDGHLWQPLATQFGAVLTRQQALAMALVLDSRAIPCCIEAVGEGWQLLVPAQWLESADRELGLYEAANRNWPPALPAARQLVENTLPTVSVLLLLATFYNLTLIGLTLPERGLVNLFDLGAGHAASIMNGQWWRLVTALTLHAGLVHLLSNLVIGGVFIILLCRELGSGLAWSLILASGIFGNLANALVQSPAHSSVGASTAVFGTVGILAAIAMVRYRRHAQRRWFIPVAAGLALLAVLGTEGKNTDLGAHLFGFGAGVLLGVMAELSIGKHGRPGGIMNFLLALASAALVVAAWWAAIATGG